VSQERQIEMTWRCSSCQAQNLGRHLACQACGSPKDDSEAYEMPADTAQAATVTDSALLRMAEAGANFRCRYCGSDQRAFEGTCAQCGAGQGEGPSAEVAAPRPRAVASRAPRGLSLVVVAGLACVALSLVVCGLGRRAGRVRGRLAAGATALTLPFHDEAVKVTGVRWRQVVEVERWQILPGEGFEESKPAEAFQVRPSGTRFHHTERVVAGYDTQSYTETVPDGYRTESYTSRESCGTDCTSRPQTCSEKCTPNKNGFATCRTVCSGGGQDCRTKYCDVQKTRQVPKTRTETRTRQVPRYADVPRNAPWYSWKVWDWKLVRTLEETGTTPQTRWPSDAEVRLGKGLGPGERERERRRGSYTLELSGAAAPRHVDVSSAAALAERPVGGQARVRVWSGGRVQLL
jgi:hypothetical protein